MYLFAFMIAGMFLFLAYFTYIGLYKQLEDGSKCTEKTLGRIRRYSLIQYNGMNLPIVDYQVGEKRYTVVGPHFLPSRVRTTSSPTAPVFADVKMSGLEGDEISQRLAFKVHRNSFVSLSDSPLKKRFPIGGTVTVYYNPKKPHMAYVERPLKESWSRKLTRISIIFFIGFQILVAILMPILILYLINL